MAARAFKVVVTGPFNAGKTAFVQAASDIAVVATERRITGGAPLQADKQETTVAMDYGQRRVGKSLLHLYGTPGQARFEFMWSILAREMDAFLLLVDSTDKASLMEAKQMVRQFRKYAKVPYLVVANKADGSRLMSPEEIGRLLGLPASVQVVPCVAHKKDSVTQVLKLLEGMLA